MADRTVLIRIKGEFQGLTAIQKNITDLKLKMADLGLKGVEMSKTMKVADNTFITSRGVINASGQFQHLSSTVRDTSKSFALAHPMLAQYQKALARVAIVVPLWATMRAAIQAVSGAISDSVKHFVDLDSGLARAQAVARGTAEEISAAMTLLRKSAEDFAATNKGTAKDVTEAFYQMGTAGIDLRTSLAASVPVAKLANATYGDTVTVGKAVAGMYNVLGDSITNATTPQEKMSKLTDVLASAWSNHRIELNELQRAISNVGAQAKRFGLTMEETVAIVATSSDFLIESGRAGTLFSRVLGDMSNKLPAVETLLGRTFDKTKPIAWFQVFKEVIASINKMGAGTPQAEQTLENIFGERARRQAGIFLTEMNKVVATIDEFNISSQGMVQKLADIRNNTTEAQLEIYHKNIALIGANFITGAIGGTSFAESLKIINETLKSIAENAIIAGAGTNQFITNMGAVPKLIGFFTGGLVGLETELLKGTITIEQFTEMVTKSFDETLKGVDFLSEAEVNALVKFKTSIQKSGEEISKMSAIIKKASDTNKENPLLPTKEDMEESIKFLKAVGATEIQIAQEKIKWQLLLAQGDEKNVEVIKARNEQRNLELALIRKNAEAVSSLFSTSLSEALKEGDITKFTESLREKVKNAFIDAIAEGITNQVMSITNLDVVLGKQLDALKFQRALIDGSTEGSQKYYNAIVSASNIAASKISTNAGSNIGANITGGAAGKEQGFSLITDAVTGRQKQVPIAPDDFYTTAPSSLTAEKTKTGGGMFDFLKNQKFQQGLGASLLAFSLFGGNKSNSSMSRTHTTSPSGGTVAATTASTTKAYVTNINMPVTFNLPDSVGTDTKSLVKAMASSMTPVLQEMVKKVLEAENISSGLI